MQRCIGLIVKISRNSGLLLTIVPWLYQCTFYIKRKLREWRPQKYNPWFGAKSPLRCTGLQNTRFHAAPYTAYIVDFPKLWASFNHGTMIAPIYFLYPKKLLEWRTHKCNLWYGAKSPLRSTGMQNSGFHTVRYRANCADFPKFGASFNKGTVIAPVHSLYQKEATGMENP